MCKCLKPRDWVSSWGVSERKREKRYRDWALGLSTVQMGRWSRHSQEGKSQGSGVLEAQARKCFREKSVVTCVKSFHPFSDRRAGNLSVRFGNECSL